MHLYSRTRMPRYTCACLCASFSFFLSLHGRLWIGVPHLIIPRTCFRFFLFICLIYLAFRACTLRTFGKGMFVFLSLDFLLSAGCQCNCIVSLFVGQYNFGLSAFFGLFRTANRPAHLITSLECEVFLLIRVQVTHCKHPTPSILITTKSKKGAT